MKSATRLPRAMVALALSAASTGCLIGDSATGSASDEVTQPVDSLAAAAAGADRLIGTAVGYPSLESEPLYREVLTSEHDYVTPEN
jgi:hypothetical protein